MCGEDAYAVGSMCGEDHMHMQPGASMHMVGSLCARGLEHVQSGAYAYDLGRMRPLGARGPFFALWPSWQVLGATAG